MGCAQGKDERVDEIINLYETKIEVLNAEISKLEKENEKKQKIDRCTLLQANEPHEMKDIENHKLSDVIIENTQF